MRPLGLEPGGGVGVAPRRRRAGSDSSVPGPGVGRDRRRSSRPPSASQLDGPGGPSPRPGPPSMTTSTRDASRRPDAGSGRPPREGARPRWGAGPVESLCSCWCASAPDGGSGPVPGGPDGADPPGRSVDSGPGAPVNEWGPSSENLEAPVQPRSATGGPIPGPPERSERPREPPMTTRADLLERARSGGTWDVVVIGGGATGLGTAVDAATRGYRTLAARSPRLRARGPPAGAPSSSTAASATWRRGDRPGPRGPARARAAAAQRPAPGPPASFLVPAYRYWSTAVLRHRPEAVRPARRAAGARAVAWASAGEAVSIASRRSGRDGLRGGIVYQDGQFDDARLAIALAWTAVDQGGTALNSRPRRRAGQGRRPGCRSRRPRRRDGRGIRYSVARRGQRHGGLRRRRSASSTTRQPPG